MADKLNILVVNGPNLNMLGMREPETYGSLTLSDIETKCRSTCDKHGFALSWMQSNSEATLIDTIQNACGTVDWIIINAAGLTHSSVALRDALALFPGDVIEVQFTEGNQRQIPHLRCGIGR